MSVNIYERTEKKLRNLVLEKRLLQLRLDDYIKNFNSNATTTRKYSNDIKLIHSSQTRLLQIEREINSYSSTLD